MDESSDYLEDGIELDTDDPRVKEDLDQAMAVITVIIGRAEPDEEGREEEALSENEGPSFRELFAEGRRKVMDKAAGRRGPWNRCVR